ncbi:MAG: bifunctional phosphoglucose/phosphomannose isomerase [Chloroflexota bacterium]
MIDLDDIQEIRRLDPEGMLDRIAELPAQLRDAWRNVANFPLPSGYTDVANVVIMGIGGSAIGGDLVSALVESDAKVPIAVVRGYELPGYVGPRSLVIAASYSGNTEETLAGYDQARQRNAKLLAVTTNGQLLKAAQEHGMPVLQFHYQSQPRAALGHSLVPILGILQEAHVIDSRAEEVEEAARVLETLQHRIGPNCGTAHNLAKQLALDLHGHLPFVYGGGVTSAVARRWKGQFNENSKAWASFDILPELNHNSVVGYENPAELAEVIRVVFLSTDYVHPRVKARFGVTQEILRQRGVKFHVVPAEGKTALAQMMASVYYGDYTSYYLALLYDVDPTPVKIIDFLKAELAKV